jgi:hypothetical protein
MLARNTRLLATLKRNQTMTNRKASVGTVSHGTLRTADLLICFASELDYLRGNDDATKLVDSLPTIGSDDETEIDDSRQESIELLETLFDELNELAPPYCYFGAHEGDGSDFGFWPSMDAIDELPRIKNEEGETLPDEDHCYVNDHGNVTVYGANGTVLLELV